MSLETHAREALRAAIIEIYDVDVSPEQFDDVKPSDGGIGAKNGPAWFYTLEDAAVRLEAMGYSVSPPTLVKAAPLREQVLMESSIYLEELAGASLASTFVKIAAAGAITALVGWAALKLHSQSRGDR